MNINFGQQQFNGGGPVNLTIAAPQGPPDWSIGGAKDQQIEADLYRIRQQLPQIEQALQDLQFKAQGQPAESPSAIAAQARTAALQNMKDMVMTRNILESRLPGQDQLSRSLKNRLTHLSNLEPGSPQALEMEGQINSLAQQRPDLAPAVQPILIDVFKRSLRNIHGALSTIKANLQPQSAEAQTLDKRVLVLDKMQMAVDHYIQTTPGGTKQGAMDFAKEVAGAWMKYLGL